MASRVASADLTVESLVPEGLDDLQVEGADPAQVEIKSRQLRLGPFSVGDSAPAICASLVRHWNRFGSARKLKIVFEQGLVGLDAAADEVVRALPLLDVLEAAPRLRKAVAWRIERCELSSSDFEALAQVTEVITGTWDDFLRETDRHILDVVALPPAALTKISLSLRLLFAEAADANAELAVEQRARLDRSSVLDAINETASLLDIDAIEVALSRGICSPLERSPLATGDAYYEGLATQPGHVAAGLVVPRPDVAERILNGLQADKTVLLTGPSGVGKSAALWTLPSALPGVVWFRLNKVADEDLAYVERLVRAYATSSRWSVGLLADAVGRGQFGAWSQLRQRIAAIPGAILVGTARREDLFTLDELADCHVVTVALDEQAAAIIHAGLLRRGATAIPHWQEAFEQSGGLTMEFTYLLTRGARLRDVIADQVADRVSQGRELELQILALASTADQWSATLPTSQLQGQLEVDAFGLKTALARLVEEHLVVDHGGSIAGVHQVRSRAISEAIHNFPPPLLSNTVDSVLRMLQGDELSRFVYGALRDAPNLDAAVLETVKDVVQEDIEQLLSVLLALEMVDFHRQASAWAKITERHAVPPAHRPLVLEFATAGLDFPEVFPQSFLAAGGAIRALPVQSNLRDTLLEAVGMQVVAGALDTASDPLECVPLLQAVRGTSLEWGLLAASFARPSALASALSQCETILLTECIEAARRVSAPLAEAVVNAAGGVDAMLQRIRMDDPWIVELQIEQVEDRLTGVARYLYLSSEEQGDARERSVTLGRQLLRLLPSIEQVDVKPLGPDGQVLTIAGDEIASSGLLRRYDHGPAAIDWNRRRFRLVQSQFGVSETERLGELARLLNETTGLCREYGSELVRPSGLFVESQKLNERRLSIDAMARQIPPPFGSDPFVEPMNKWLDGDLSAFVTNIADKSLPRLHEPEQWNALSAWLNDTVLDRDIEQCRALEWRLIGLHAPPDALTEISNTLNDIDAVLRELVADPRSGRAIRNEARRGIRKNALARAAETARRMSNERTGQRRDKIEAELRSVVPRVTISWIDGGQRRGTAGDFAVGVPVDSLFEWNVALDLLVGKFEELRQPAESLLIVPILRGKTVWRLAMQLVQQLWPVTEPGEFQRLLPNPIEERLTEQVGRCCSALQDLSGLSVLAVNGEIDTRLSPVVEHARQDFDAASGTILALGVDAVIVTISEWLLEVAEQVNAEWEGRAEPGEYAANVWSGAFGTPSADSGALDVIVALSLEWDVDPAGALETLDALTS